MATALYEAARIISRVPGRERWAVPVIRNRPEIGAAVEAAVRRQPYILDAHANCITGSILLRWDPNGPTPAVAVVLERAVDEPPATIDAMRARVLERRKDRKTARLIQKLVLGGVKLLLIFSSRVVARPAAKAFSATIGGFSVITIMITGYDFLRALWRTVSRRSAFDDNSCRNGRSGFVLCRHLSKRQHNDHCEHDKVLFSDR